MPQPNTPIRFVVLRGGNKNAKDASFVALRKFGKERVVILFSDQSDPDLMKSLALDVVYENESLLNNFKKEYKPLR